MISPQIHRMCSLPLLLHSPHCASQYICTHVQIDLGVALLLCCLCHCIATALHSNLARPARIFPVCDNLTTRHMSACFPMSCQFQCIELICVWVGYVWSISQASLISLRSCVRRTALLYHENLPGSALASQLPAIALWDLCHQQSPRCDNPMCQCGGISGIEYSAQISQ